MNGLKGLRTCTLDELHAMRPDFDLVDYATASRRRVMAGDLDAARVLVVSHGADASVWDWLQGRVDAATMLRFADEADFDAVLQRAGASMRAMDSVTMREAQPGAGEYVEELSLAQLAGETNTVVKTLGSTLFDAFRSGASDIHIESRPGGATIKYRLDGVLVHGGEIGGADTAEQVISRIKVLAQLDVGERRLPQDGRFKLRLDGREADFRVSVIPGSHGEDAVMRVLDRRNLTNEADALDLERLGFRGEALARIRWLAARPHGMMLMTGPTGSGKTTTLYAALSEVNDGRQKIITVEDPVEYQLHGVLQVPVNERTGMTFSRGLRAILRHDPDTILVGEIRDEETAQIAVQAALTGHLVLSSIHANTAFDVLARFLHMGVDPYNLTSALNGVVAQRLVRLSCARCREEVPRSAAVRERFPQLRAAAPAARGRGCGECRGTGYRGRVAIAEVLIADHALREGILQRESPRRLRERAVGAGMRRMVEDAVALFEQGLTTEEELLRVAEME